VTILCQFSALTDDPQLARLVRDWGFKVVSKSTDFCECSTPHKKVDTAKDPRFIQCVRVRFLASLCNVHDAQFSTVRTGSCSPSLSTVFHH
jgi:hypothetical protein